MFICKTKIGNSSSSHLSRNGLGQSLGKWSGDNKRRHSRSSVATQQFLKPAWATRDLVFMKREEGGKARERNTASVRKKATLGGSKVETKERKENVVLRVN